MNVHYYFLALYISSLVTIMLESHLQWSEMMSQRKSDRSTKEGSITDIRRDTCWLQYLLETYASLLRA